MKRFWYLGFFVLLALAGCTPKPGPAVNIVNVKFKDMTAFETTMAFTLRFDNDKPDALQVTGGAHKIYLNGLYVGEGLSADALEIPRLGTATQDVTVHMNNIALATRIKPIIESRSFDYRIRSTLYSNSGRMRSETEGRLDLKDFTPDETGEGASTNQVTNTVTAPANPPAQ
jgi:LEA14-like dessication related protein